MEQAAMTHPHVRRVRPDDETNWTALFRDYVAFYRANVADDVIALTWSRVLDAGSGMISLVAVDEADTPVGLALIVLHRSSWSKTWYCYLEDLFVAADQRGRGLGLALIEAVYAEADLHGATRTYWVTEEDNEAAQRLYARVAKKAPYVQFRR
jgi:GNAT superfamily N-acetyltransferase